MRYKIPYFCNLLCSWGLLHSLPDLRYKTTSPAWPGACNNWGAIFSMVHLMQREAPQMHKRPISWTQLRRVPRQFSWVDQRLVRERYIDRLSHEACALYLFLVTVADAQGLSYYADRTLSQRLSMSRGQLAQARHTLITQRLLAYRRPLYQVLALETRSLTQVPELQASDDEVDLQAVFEQIWEVLK
jgi:hypothetical protein